MKIINNKISLLGLGKCGGKLVESFANSHISPVIKIAAVDSDTAFLSSLEGVKKLNVGSHRTENLGCGGNPERGKKAVRDDMTLIRNLVQDTGFVIVVAGLGKGFATGAVGEIAQMLKTLPVVPVFVVTTPFVIEGGLTRSKSEKALEQLNTKVKNVINISNNLMYSQAAADTPMEDLFSLADKALIDGIRALIDIIKHEPNDTISLDFSVIAANLSKRQRECALSHGICEGKDFEQLAKSFIECPLSGGVAYIKSATSVILKLTTPILTSSETKKCIDILNQHLECGNKLNIGFHFESNAAKCSLSGLLIKEHENGRSGSRSSSGQLELDLVERSRGIFTGQPAKIHDKEGYDLNIPTFQRLEISLDEV